MVAEVTGRSRRIVRKGERLVVESRTGSANLAETTAFMDDLKRILVFSDAGGTGRSYHAELSARNRRLRVHYALLRKGAAQEFRGRRVSVEAFYLATGEVMLVPAKGDDKLIAEYADAIDGIERGEFHAEPEARRCPNCPSYFICTGA
nr:strawberry notch C-terminal domain-containing protein [Bradyrhizobium sp. SZCCHNS2005]